ncbi:unnamed protein product [Blepharisma stoltei]|uniref:EF-hand domain-containing protein n=1 Tax=Blepharisma stoltei TaxID=1481888 RepID=A0AAU9JEV7_9CILI|nr:unnamed protein product [Blepharisma stoltei]
MSRKLAEVTSKKAPQKPVVEIRMTEDEIKDCKEAFDIFDSDISGTINPKEVQAAINSLGDDRTNTIFRLLAGIEELGAEIDFDAFLAHINERLGHRNSKEGIQRIMDLFDSEGTGTITVKNLARVSRELGESMTVEELTEAIEKVSTKGAELTFDDFYKVMTKKIYG